MANTYFAFKRFVIRQEKCAMKVGTDGVLLGAWTDVSGARTILDVGVGTGLVALMLAQRSDADVYGLEIDGNAVEQARENAGMSPWKDRVRLMEGDFKAYCPGIKFDLIVSNPPYFKNSLQSPDQKRNMARHDEGLSFYVLITKAAALLAPDGRLSLIVPAASEEELMELAAGAGLFPQRLTYVRPTALAGAKRLLVSFGFCPQPCSADSLTIEVSRHVYTPEFMNLTGDYYLDK